VKHILYLTIPTIPNLLTGMSLAIDIRRAGQRNWKAMPNFTRTSFSAKHGLLKIVRGKLSGAPKIGISAFISRKPVGMKI